MVQIRMPANLGTRLPGRPPVVTPPALNQTAQAVGDLGRVVTGIATDWRAQEHQREQEERTNAARAKGALALNIGEIKLREQSELIAERILRGEITEKEAANEWTSLSTDLLNEHTRDIDPLMREGVTGALHAEREKLGATVLRRAARQRLRDETKAGVIEGLALLERQALTDRATATGRAQALVTGLGPAIGLGPDDQARMLGEFRGRVARNVGSAMLRAAREDAGAIDAVLSRLKSDEFADLSAEHLGQLEQQALVRRQYLDHRAEAAVNRARVEAERAEVENYGRALLQVETTGRVEPDTWMTLKDGHRASILNRQKAEAREREGKVRTDWNLYLTLREQAVTDPKAFAAIDLKEYVDRLGGTQLEQLVDLKGKIITGVGKAPRDAVSLTQQMNATMASLGITKASTKGKFITYVQQAVDAETQAKGKALTFDERQRVIDEATLKGPDPDAWLWGDKRMFELTPEQRARFRPNPATDAPATEVDALNDALRQQGLPLTPANRLRLYQRATRGGQ